MLGKMKLVTLSFDMDDTWVMPYSILLDASMARYMTNSTIHTMNTYIAKETPVPKPK